MFDSIDDSVRSLSAYDYVVDSATVIGPICGMTVIKEGAAFVHEHEGLSFRHTQGLRRVTMLCRRPISSGRLVAAGSGAR